MKDLCREFNKAYYGRSVPDQWAQEIPNTGLDIRAGYFWKGPMGGAYSNQGYTDIPHCWPSALPPPTCDRPEYVKFLKSHWAYALGIHPAMI